MFRLLGARRAAVRRPVLSVGLRANTTLRRLMHTGAPIATSSSAAAKSVKSVPSTTGPRLWRRQPVVASASPASAAIARALHSSSALRAEESKSDAARPIGNAYTYATVDAPAGMAIPKGMTQSDVTLSRYPHITAESLARYPHTKLTTLPNGIRVATERGFGETATVGVWIDTGSRYETEKTNGVAHFLEHLFFKGTERRDQQALEVEVENIGGHLNAYTSREQTVFYAKTFKKDVPQAMDILGDILLNSKFSEEAIERERAVILREHEEVNNNNEEVIFDRLHETAFRGTSLARPILGSVENIKSITRNDIVDYVQTHYTAPRMVICGAGAIDHEQLVALASKIFANVPREPPTGKKVVFEPAKFTGSDLRIRFDTMDHAHIALAFPTAGWTDPDAFPLMVIQTLMGCWDKSTTGGKHSSSYMIEQIATNHLAHTVQTFNTQYSDIGLFGVYATCDATGQNDLMYVLTQQTTRLSIQLEEFQLQEAKNQLKMNMLASLDGSTVVCEDIGRQMLTYGRRMHPSEVMARIDAVDLAAVKNVATRYFYDRDHCLAAIGPIHELPHYMWIRRRTYSMRF